MLPNSCMMMLPNTCMLMLPNSCMMMLPNSCMMMLPNYCMMHVTQGSLLLMEGAVQEDWLHCLPKVHNRMSYLLSLSLFEIASLPDLCHPRTRPVRRKEWTWPLGPCTAPIMFPRRWSLDHVASKTKPSPRERIGHCLKAAQVSSIELFYNSSQVSQCPAWCQKHQNGPRLFSCNFIPRISVLES